MFYRAQIYLRWRKGIEQFLDGLTLTQKAERRIQSNLLEKAFDNENLTSTFLVSKCRNFFQKRNFKNVCSSNRQS